MTPLRFPLTARALRSAFEELEPETIRLDKKPGWHEATIDGAWSFGRVQRHLARMGLGKVGGRDSRCFADQAGAVGVVLHGVAPHPTRNAYRTWTIEVFARKDLASTRAALF